MGKGRYEWPDGSWYEGDIALGVRHGFGKHATAGEDCVYEGEWKDGVKHGKGLMKFKNGYNKLFFQSINNVKDDL